MSIVSIVLVVLSVIVNVVGMCKFDWFEDAEMMTMGLVMGILIAVCWFASLPTIAAAALIYYFCKGMMKLCKKR